MTGCISVTLHGPESHGAVQRELAMAKRAVRHVDRDVYTTAAKRLKTGCCLAPSTPDAPNGAVSGVPLATGDATRVTLVP